MVVTQRNELCVPMATTMNCKVICHCTVEFNNISAPSHLSLTTCPAHYTYFCQCLNGGPHDHWDVVATGHPQTVAGFQATNLD